MLRTAAAAGSALSILLVNVVERHKLVVSKTPQYTNTNANTSHANTKYKSTRLTRS